MIPLFATTLLISSILLFSIQPMVGKLLLPLLGGTPAVWNTCLMFFQAALLAGYSYANFSVRRLGVRRHAVIHIVLLLAALASLPIHLAADNPPTAEGSPIPWLLLRLASTIGLPFFVISATAPLLQRWFAETNRPAGRDPYFLYAASNIGSLAGLLGYPLIVEPNFTLVAQARLWAYGYDVVLVLILACAGTLCRTPAAAFEPETVRHEGLSSRRRLHWVLLAAVPSSLMLGVTTHITTNIAAVPLLWAAPLALYLLTFVIVFSRRPIIPRSLAALAWPYLVLPMGLLFFATPQALGWAAIPLHLLTFFLAAMMCHGELVRTRPPVEHLTEFYFWMSLGGVLGGAFNAIVAPQAFCSVVEYPLAVVAACLLMPAPSKSSNGRTIREMIWPVGIGLAALGIGAMLDRFGITVSWLSMFAVYFLPALACFAMKERPLRFGLGLGAVLLATHLYSRPAEGNLLLAERNFFGIKQVIYDPKRKIRLLAHGTTNHGCQSTQPDRSREPLAYFHRKGPIGDVFSMLPPARPARQIAVLGLGVGSLAAYVEPGGEITFYEIDPDVERIARDPRFFTFLADCRGKASVVLGDGRLSLAQAAPASYDIIVLDAFSSDAVPTHLLSLEALRLYLTRLRPEGVVVYNISNRFLNLVPVVAALADSAGLVCYERFDERVSDEELAAARFPCRYVVMARSKSDLGALANNPRWHVLHSSPAHPVWTDQYSDIINVVRLPRPFGT